MNTTIKLLCAWSGPALATAVLGGLILANVLPFPPAAFMSPDEIARFYTQSTTRTLTGFALTSFCMGFAFPLTGLIAVYLVRMEGRTPILTFTQLSCGAATGVLLTTPMILMAVCAFRPDRSPELIQLLNDAAYLLLFTPIAPFCIQNTAIAMAIFNDRNPQPVLPRWVAFANLWLVFLFLPGLLPFFFHEGPFAWHGVFVFWLGLASFGGWATMMGLVLRQAVLRDAAAAAGT